MKRILTTLFTLAIIMAGSVPALAAGEETSTGQSVIFYPISVEEYTYGTLRRSPKPAAPTIWKPSCSS